MRLNLRASSNFVGQIPRSLGDCLIRQTGIRGDWELSLGRTESRKEGEQAWQTSLRFRFFSPLHLSNRPRTGPHRDWLKTCFGPSNAVS